LRDMSRRVHCPRRGKAASLDSMTRVWVLLGAAFFAGCPCASTSVAPDGGDAAGEPEPVPDAPESPNDSIPEAPDSPDMADTPDVGDAPSDACVSSPEICNG